jgi:DnaJ-class molecular chaperone
VRLSRILLLALVTGCVNATAVDRPDIVADLACETARMVVQLGQQMTPAPASDKCDNCDGTGKIGDGRIVMTCPVCKGTGKRAKSVLVTGTCTTGACKP